MEFSHFTLALITILLHFGFERVKQVAGYEIGSSRHSEPLHRFKSLDRVLNRLDGGIGPKKTTEEAEERKETSPVPALVGTPRDEEDDYDEDEDESAEYDDDQTESGRHMSHSQYPAWKGRTSPSTSRTTTTMRTTTTPPTPQMSYSQYKWQNLGTRQGVEQYRRNSLSPTHPPQRHYNHHHKNGGQQHGHHAGSSRGSQGSSGPDTSIREAINHALKVSKDGSCKVPKPRLVRVQDFYPHPGKTYVPHCTILHQCSDDTGCCRHDVLSCSPKTTQRIELTFYTITVDSSRGSSVERLVFYNHTECECRDRMEDLMPRDGVVPPPPGSKNGNHLDSPLPYESSSKKTHRTKHQCPCPSAFTERVLPDGSCSCDCFDKDNYCLRLKRGKDFFSMQDKWCVQSGRCEEPTCAYGVYIHLAGRCSRKKERSSWTHPYNPN